MIFASILVLCLYFMRVPRHTCSCTLTQKRMWNQYFLLRNHSHPRCNKIFIIEVIILTIAHLFSYRIYFLCLEGKKTSVQCVLLSVDPSCKYFFRHTSSMAFQHSMESLVHFSNCYSTFDFTWWCKISSNISWQ